MSEDAPADDAGCARPTCSCADAGPRAAGDGGADAVPPADFDRLHGHEPAADLGEDTEHCIRCGFCTTACPVFAETGWESVTPRGHTNVILAYLDGELDGPAVKRNLDLCIKCKGCIPPCPAGVEIPKLVTRANEKYNDEHGVSLGDRAFANPRLVNRLGSLTAPLSNLADGSDRLRALLERVLGIDARRPLPTFHRRTFADRFAARDPEPTAGDRDRRVALYVDCYVNHNFPTIGLRAVDVLERAGATVDLIDPGCCGRAALSKGLIETAESNADAVVEELAARVADGYDIVCVEPSCASMLADEFTDMYDDPRVDAVAANTYELMAYVAELLDEDASALAFRSIDRRVACHAHCHAKHLGTGGAAAAVLRRIPDLDVDEPSVTCCGMAGSFGYQAAYYDLSLSIGERLFEQVRDSGGDPVAAGYSCRTQLADGMGVRPEHPIELVAESTRP